MMRTLIPHAPVPYNGDSATRRTVQCSQNHGEADDARTSDDR